ncbi:unnamed protein product, partial [Phytomonas sp. Hart1]
MGGGDSKEATQSENIDGRRSAIHIAALSSEHEIAILRRALKNANLRASRRQVECEELQHLCDALQSQLQDAFTRETFYHHRLTDLTGALAGLTPPQREGPSRDPTSPSFGMPTSADADRSPSPWLDKPAAWRDRYEELVVELRGLKTAMAEQKAVLDRLGLHPPYREEMVGAACLMMPRLKPLDAVKNLHRRSV